MSLFLKTIFQIKVLVPILIITTTTAGVIYYNQVINNDNETDNQTKTNQSDSNKETKTKTKTYTLTYISGSNGTISGNLTQTVKEGEDGEVVTAIPDTGYHFTSWSDNNSTTASRTDTNIRQDITTTARFEKEEESITQAGIPVTKTIATTTNPVAKSYTLTYTAGTNGSITGTNPQTIEYGSDGSAVTAAPDAGYHFTDWSDGVLTATRTDTNITANLSVTASFVINTYDITPSASVGGTISPDSIQTVEYGDDKTFSFTSNTGYHIDDVLVDGISHGNITNYTFSNIQDNHTISATFAINTFSLIAISGAGGTVNPSGTKTVNYNGTQTYTISPNSGYKINNVEIDGASVGAVSSHTFSNINSNHTISATFTADAPTPPVVTTHTISVSASTIKPESDTEDGGYITPNSGVVVENGKNQAFQIVANNNTKLLDVIVDGTSLGPIDSYSFTNVTSNHTISATFIRQYTISVSSDGDNHGDIAPSEPLTLDFGDNFTFSIIPFQGYEIKDIKADGESLLLEQCVFEDKQVRCTIEKIDKDYTISVQYTKTSSNQTKDEQKTEEGFIQSVVNNITKPLSALVLFASNSLSEGEKVLSQISEKAIKVIEKTPPPVAYVFPYLLFILLGLITLIFLYQTKREAEQAQDLMGLIELDKNIADQKENFLMLSAHYLRTPLTIIVSGADLFMSLAKASESIVGSLKTALDKLSSQVEEIFKQINDNIFLKNIKETNTAEEKAKVFGSIYLWLPIILVAGIAAFSNYLFVTIAGIDINTINYICEALALVIVAQILFIYFRKKQIEKANRLKFAIILDKQIAVDNARNDFMKKTAEGLKEELNNLKEVVTNITDKKYLKEVNKGIKDLEKLIEKFEFMAAVEAGKINLKTTNIALGKIVEDLVDDRQKQIEEKKIRLEIVNDGIEVMTDKNKLSFILGNILNNAIEYNKEKGLIKIEFKDEKNNTEIVISDTGVGISEKAQEELFRPFSRGTSTLRFDHQGMGTSLYIAKLVANYIGGDIVIKSTEGKGAQAIVLLPKR